MANVFVLRSHDIGDDKIKSIYFNGTLQNGDAVSLGDFSTTRPTVGCYQGLTPAEGKDIVLVYDAEVPFMTNAKGDVLRGFGDVRDIEFPANKVVNAFMPEVGQEFAYTAVSGISNMATYEPAATDYVVIKAGSKKPELAQNTTGALVAMKVIGKGYISIGLERVPTVEVRCL